MITLLNYANQAYKTSQRKNSRTGLTVGGFDRVLSYGPDDIDAGFRRAHQHILEQPRGNGYWLWKPYFIARTLKELPEGEWLFYADSGSYFIQSIAPLVALAQSHNLDLLTFEDAHLEKKYAKRDALILLDADRPEILARKQRLAAFSLWRSSPVSRQFTTSWLQYCTDPRVLTDQPNTLGFANHDAFQDHRHDQAVFSILAKQQQLPGFRDPSQWGNDKLNAYPNSPYPQLIDHTRQRDRSLWKQFKDSVKSSLRTSK